MVAKPKDVDWEHILDEEAPFVPQPDNATDTTYFNTRYRSWFDTSDHWSLVICLVRSCLALSGLGQIIPRIRPTLIPGIGLGLILLIYGHWSFVWFGLVWHGLV